MPLDVLIVDDSAAIRKILHRVLRQAGFPVGHVLEAGDGLQAMEALKQQTVHLILSDTSMPNLDGMQLLRKVKSNPLWHSVPFVLITSEGSEATVMEAAKLGASGYVRKPFTTEQIKKTLSSLY